MMSSSPNRYFLNTNDARKQTLILAKLDILEYVQYFTKFSCSVQSSSDEKYRALQLLSSLSGITPPAKLKEITSNNLCDTLYRYYSNHNLIFDKIREGQRYYNLSNVALLNNIIQLVNGFFDAVLKKIAESYKKLDSEEELSFLLSSNLDFQLQLKDSRNNKAHNSLSFVFYLLLVWSVLFKLPIAVAATTNEAAKMGLVVAKFESLQGKYNQCGDDDTCISNNNDALAKLIVDSAIVENDEAVYRAKTSDDLIDEYSCRRGFMGPICKKLEFDIIGNRNRQLLKEKIDSYRENWRSSVQTQTLLNDTGSMILLSLSSILGVSSSIVYIYRSSIVRKFGERFSRFFKGGKLEKQQPKLSLQYLIQRKIDHEKKRL